MWKISIYIAILFKCHCVLAQNLFLDQVGECVDDASPFMSDQIKKECKMNTAELASEHKYNAETHDVVTKDGYILTMFRIRNDTACPKNRSILLMHGLFGDSTNWIMNLGGQSPGYTFADEGYDVWLGNNRGNTYSSKHVTLSTSDCEYWNFTLDQLAEYDLLAMIDFILENTGSENLHYVGYSQGTTIMLMLLSKFCEAATKLCSVNLYAPVAFLKDSTSLMAEAVDLLYEPLQIGRNAGFPKPSELTKAFSTAMYGSPVRPAFETVLKLIMGPSDNHVNKTRMPIALHHFPCPVGVGQLAQFAQFRKFNVFGQFNYGKFGNLAAYGQCEPPIYDLKKIKCENIYMHSSDNDILADSIDVDKLFCILGKNVKHSFRIKDEDEKFNHSDYMQSLDGRRLVYDITVKIMKSIDCPNSYS